MNRNRWAKTAP